MQVIEIQPPVVAHPAGIDRVVLARCLAINDVLARADDRVAAGRATRAKTFRFLQKPDPHLETKIRRSQRADRADVDRVERVIILQPLARMGGEGGVAPAIDEPEDVVLRDFLGKTNAARAEDAALVIERDARAELHVLRLLHFVLKKTRILPAILDAEFLEPAFARLVADRAIERVIDKEKFHHATAAFLDQRRVGAHPKAFGNIGRAANLRTRHPIDLGFAVVAERRFAIRTHLRHAHFDQAHAAVAGGVIVGDLPNLEQEGSAGTQVGLAVATTSCNNGDQPLDWFQLPNTDHPVIPQNLYRMSRWHRQY